MERTGSNSIKHRIENYWSEQADAYDGQFGHGIGSSAEKALRDYVRNKRSLPFFGGAEPSKIRNLIAALGFTDIRQDDMAQILSYERRNGPIEYRIAYSKNRRYLICASKPNHAEPINREGVVIHA